MVEYEGHFALFFLQLRYIISSSTATSESSLSSNVPLSRPPLKKSRPEISRSNSISTHQRLTNQRAEEVVLRRWSVSAGANERWSREHKALASTIVGHLSVTLFAATRRLFKEAQRVRWIRPHLLMLCGKISVLFFNFKCWT